MTRTEYTAALALSIHAEHHARRAVKHTQTPTREGELRRRLRKWQATHAIRLALRAVVKLHKICADNIEDESYERRLRPLVQRTRNLMDKARGNIVTRNDDDDWHSAMCMSENGATLCDVIDEEVEIGSVAAFCARGKRGHQRRSAPTSLEHE